ncbi:alpha-mannosidase IC (MNSIC) [Fusarium beomiforme]|uniref:alpha-1,2-Mannosidase n=1 Tax=Fusarium beomiforme TaxID=44412 RepID=A0A9P5AU15_9HYPO|nr:alpha-mannosidase IC (MNSIC) [Fusarium beomiforme]
MLATFQGRPGRRYISLFLFIAITWFLIHNFRPYDWSKQQVFHPAEDIRSPPNGTFKLLPRIQKEHPDEYKEDSETTARKAAIKQAFTKSWEAYKKYAWGWDELAPISLHGKTTFSGWAAQIVDALDTLWILDMKDEFREAVKVVAMIDWSRTGDDYLNLFEVAIRHLGGLLSAYELSDEAVLLGKAIELGEMLYAAFDTPNRLPSHWLYFKAAKTGSQQADQSMSGAAGGSMCLEFTRLSQITGNPKYYDATERIKQFFYRNQDKTKIPGLWPHVMNYRDEKVDEGRFTLGAGADSLYEYLPKMHALLGGLDPEYVEMTTKALDTATKHILYKPRNPEDLDILMSGNVLADEEGKKPELTAEMQHLTCFVGGTYALAGKLLSRNDFVDLGSRLTAGCIWAYDAFPTNIMPEIAQLEACESITSKCHWNDKPVEKKDKLPDGFIRVRNSEYRLRPEAIESVFYMWRITGDDVWRDAAWRMWEAIVKQTETQEAFATISDVNRKGSDKRDNMETFWMSETIKYFYLTFDDPSVINLDEWVLNTEAHPFRRPKGEEVETPKKKTMYAQRQFFQHVAPGYSGVGRQISLQWGLKLSSEEGDMMRSFYSLSKTHHPDANPSDPNASSKFSLISESYTVLSDKTRRAAYDRDVLRLHHHPPQTHAHRGSYHSHQPGGRAPSGLSRRRGTFRGPPPSFYRSGGWGEQADKRRKAHEESTGGGGASPHEQGKSQTDPNSPWGNPFSHESTHRGMGPGDDPFGHQNDVPHFDKAGHTRTHRREDQRRKDRRQKRAMGDDDIEFEPQTSITGHFIIISGILATAILAPLIYIQFMSIGQPKKNKS